MDSLIFIKSLFLLILIMFNFITNNTFRYYGLSTIAVWPALGKPSLLCAPTDILSSESIIHLEILCLAEPHRTLDQIRSEIAESLLMVPLLGIDPATAQARQGDPISLQLDHLQNMPILDLDNPASFANYFSYSPIEREQGLGCEPLHSSKLIGDFFNGKTQCVHVECSFLLPDIVIAYLSSHPFILFNLVQTFPEINARILPHAVCLYRKDLVGIIEHHTCYRFTCCKA